MNEHHRRRVRTLFARAADLPLEERGAFLDAHCGGEPELRAEVEVLMAYDSGFGTQSGDHRFLESPLIRAPAETSFDGTSPQGRPEPELPSHIGGYHILRRRGEGGMGIVYEAEQDNPRRIVALKVIRSGLVPELVKRFKQEAQILGRLHHPGIAQVYEAGMSEDGRLFFAMEFIRGVPLDAYARDPGLDARARLDLLARVCDAVQHAHQNGVVHRDLKPGNILVEESGQPKVLDFGIAHVTSVDLLTTSTRTRTGLLLGTWNYMSPEQFAAHPSGLDGRSDVYTLGVLLFELLAERLPYHLDQLSVHEVARVIEREEPLRLGSIAKVYRGDVEVIVARALEKDKARRYASAGELASDIRRHLRGEPIQARPVGAAGRCWRWARRNPSIAGLAGVLAGVLVLTSMGSLLAARLFYTQAQAQRTLADEREAERQIAVQAGAKEAAARGKADEANAGLRATQEELRRTVYATRSNLALAACDAADLGRVRSLLELLRPAPNEPDRRGWEWRYLWQLAHEDRLTLRAREGGFAHVAFSPDGRILAGLGRNGCIQLWDRHTGELRKTIGMTTRGRLADLSGGIGALAFSPDGRSLAGPGPDASLVLYDVDTGLPTLRFEGPPEAVLNLAWSPDRRTLIAALAKHRMRAWDARDGHLIQDRFGEHGGPVAAVAFSPDGRTIASASYDHTVKLWSPEDRDHPRAVLKGHTDEVHAVAVSPDGRRVASAGRDRTLRIWDARSGAELDVMRGHTGLVTSLAYLPDGSKVVTASADQTVRVWDTASRQELRSFKATDDLGAVAVSPDGHDIAAASNDGTVRVWDASSPPRPHTLQSPSVLTYGGDAECLAFSPDGRSLVSGHDDNALRVWDLPSGRTLLVIKGHTMPIKSVAVSPDGRTIASGSPDRSVRLWDAASGQPRLTFTGHKDQVSAVAFTADGLTVLSAGFDRTIQAWDPATGVVRYILRGHADTVYDLAISPDGRMLASASYDKTCILWDLPGGQPRLTLRGHTGRINSVAFSSDGRTLASSSDDDTVRLWDTVDGSARGILDGHIDSVEGLAFSPDGRLASSSRDKTIRVWDPAGGQTLLILKGHAANIRRIAFSPDGRTLASASDDRTIKLWEAAPEAALAAP
jgi:WD40 repeat protein/predicted Ser/Thr protein kinase